MKSFSWPVIRRLAAAATAVASILLFTGSVAWSGERHAPPQDRWIPIPLQHPDYIPPWLVGWFKEILDTDWPVIYKKGFRYAVVSLENKSKNGQDLIVNIRDPDWCGSGGCALDIYKYKTGPKPWLPGRYVRIGGILGSGHDKVWFAGTVTNGYRDLIIDKDVFLVFNRKEYIERGVPEPCGPKCRAAVRRYPYRLRVIIPKSEASPTTAVLLPTYDIDSYCLDLTRKSRKGYSFEKGCRDVENESKRALDSMSIPPKILSYCRRLGNKSASRSYSFLKGCVDLEISSKRALSR